MMNRWVAGAVATLLALVVLAGWSNQTWRPEPGLSPNQGSRSANLETTLLEGMTLRNQSERGNDIVLSIGRFFIRRRTFGVFTIKPLKEVVVEELQVRVELHADKQMAAEEEQVGPDALSEGLRQVVDVAKESVRWSSASRQGMITRVVVDDFDIELYREGAEFIRFSAGSATIGSTLDLKLRDGFSITTGQGDELIATKGRYLRDEGLLKVVGPYTFTSPVGRTSGRNALFQVTDDGEILKLDETSG